MAGSERGAAVRKGARINGVAMARARCGKVL